VLDPASAPAELLGFELTYPPVIPVCFTRSVSIPVNFLATSLKRFYTLEPLSAEISKNMISF
jgi:hypothetical protein